MKQYVIDELRPGDYQKIKAYMDDCFGPPRLGEIYRIPLSEDLLTDVQAAHAECRPHYVAAALQPQRMAFELLVRSDSKIRCSCIGYATDAQCRWLLQYADALFERLEIAT